MSHRLFSNEQVKQIREKRKAGAQLKDLSKEYGTSIATICNICLGKIYQDAPGPIQGKHALYVTYEQVQFEQSGS